MAGAPPVFMGPKSCTIFRPFFKGEVYKITNTKLGTKVNIYLD
jgi:hypothetical protein